MTKRLYLEFNSPIIKCVFPETRSDDPKGNKAEIISWESPRLTTEIPYDNRPKGSDRSICRTINGILNVRLLNKAVLRRTNNAFKDDPATKPFLTMGLYGESSGMIGAITPLQQLRLNAFGFDGFNEQILILTNSSGDIGSLVFSSYANLMQNIFLRVSISRGYTGYVYDSQGDILINYELPIEFSCSGVLIASDPR
jgi:hypothetical protein